MQAQTDGRFANGRRLASVDDWSIIGVAWFRSKISDRLGEFLRELAGTCGETAGGFGGRGQAQGVPRKRSITCMVRLAEPALHFERNPMLVLASASGWDSSKGLELAARHVEKAEKT